MTDVRAWRSHEEVRAPVLAMNGALGAFFLAFVAVLLIFAGTGCEEARGPGVVLWHAYTGTERTALEETAAKWNAAHPDMPLTLVAVPFDSFADKLTSAIPRGNGPDLFIYPHDRIGDWADAGTIEPIEFWVDDARADRFSDEAIGAMAYHGSLWGLPLSEKSLAFYYRTDLVAEPPKTTDDLIALAPKMTAHQGYALAYANVDLYGHAPWLHGFGGRILDEHGALDIDTPEAAAALRFARELVERGVAPPDAQDSQIASLFNAGKAATVIQGPWFITHIAKGVPWKVATLPTVSATGKPAAPYLGVEGVVMSSQARDKDAAFAVMDALTSDASAAIRARIARQVVANPHVYDDPELGADPVQKVFRAQLAHTVPIPQGMRPVWTPYQTALGEVLSGREQPGTQLMAVEREVASYQ